MRNSPPGLTEVTTGDLKKLLSFLHGGELRFPLDVGELTRVGLQHCAGLLLAQLRELDQRGVQAVLVAVLAERLATA